MESVILPSHAPLAVATSLQYTYPFIWNADSILFRGTYHSLTWFGRANKLKLNIIPWIIYVLYTIPIPHSQIFFRQISKAFVSFVWKDKSPRIAYDILRRSKGEGGIGLPDMALYYRAISLVCILNWCHDNASKAWVSLEKTMAGRNLAVAPWILTASRGLSRWTSPITQGCLLVWDKMKKKQKTGK